jgi:uncharacterized membrane protein
MKNKSTIISTIMCLLPMVLSAILYSELPTQIAVHFNNAGVADNYLPKAVAAFGLPVFFAVINLYLHFRVNQDPKNENASTSLKSFSRWLLPVMSIILVPVTLVMAMGNELLIVLIAQVLAGTVVVICGNYLPKCKRNYTVGIKLPWTLDSEENWNKTHRFAGFVWVIGGFVILLNAFLRFSWFVTMGMIALIIILPFLYSCLFYQKQQKTVK